MPADLVYSNSWPACALQITVSLRRRCGHNHLGFVRGTEVSHCNRTAHTYKGPWEATHVNKARRHASDESLCPLAMTLGSCSQSGDAIEECGMKMTTPFLGTEDWTRASQGSGRRVRRQGCSSFRSIANTWVSCHRVPPAATAQVPASDLLGLDEDAAAPPSAAAVRPVGVVPRCP